MGNLCGCGAEGSNTATEELLSARNGHDPPSAGWTLAFPGPHRGGIVTDVAPGGPAATVGIVVGDEILKIDQVSLVGDGRDLYLSQRWTWNPAQRVEVTCQRADGRTRRKVVMTVVGARNTSHRAVRDEVPGEYVIESEATVTSGSQLGLKPVGTLEPGTYVNVLEVRMEAGRVRGRIQRPVAGWFSIRSSVNDFAWATNRRGGGRQAAVWCDGGAGDSWGSPAPAVGPPSDGSSRLPAGLGSPNLIAKYPPGYQFDIKKMLELGVTIRLFGGELYVWGDATPAEVSRCVFAPDP
eukprot:TRINITY_DN15447_c0_g1_i1.p1 TRINITY_DN15447_c0_g1~~TRINITY_DN15447_c0_g1_i1.p1  ORF type:complete len:327 (+),score=106.13 TRINITY_DN15447_c0_g1_i1:98-982(+)